MSVEHGDAFEALMGQQLRAHADAHRGPSPMPAQARYQAAYLEDRRRTSIFAKAVALASSKAAVGLIAGAVAVSAAGATEALITNSANPMDWVATLGQQAEACSTALVPGSPGAGACLATFLPKGNKPGGTKQETDRSRTNPADHSPVTPSDKAGGGPPAGKPGEHSQGTPPGKADGGPPGGKPSPGQPAATPGVGTPGGHAPGQSPSSRGHGVTKPQFSQRKK